MRRFFISPSQLSQPQPFIEGKDAHHLRVVLRARPGDQIIVLDGQGNAYQASIVTIDHNRVYLSIDRPIAKNNDSPVEITLAQGILKDKKMDGLVRQLTELGVSRWVPFTAKRSVPAPDQRRMVARYDRWRKISMEAVKQCGRSSFMTIHSLLSFEEVIAEANTNDLKIIFWEEQSLANNPELKREHLPAKIFLMVGPEGGFEASEIDYASKNGFQIAGMGPRILKAETAALAATVLIQSTFGDMVIKKT